MEWNKAKDIVIIFLIMLNVMLGVILFMGRARYTLSAEQERNITEVLYANNIIINTSVIRSTPPMRILELAPGIIHNDAEMTAIFLGTSSAVLSDEVGNMRRYDYGNNSLIIFENMLIFENGEQGEFIDLNFVTARRISDDFLRGLGDMAGGFILDVGPYWSGNEIIIEYRQRIDGLVIYNNYFLFAIDSYGIRRIEHSNNMPIGFSAAANEICGADEALFSFLRAMRMENVERPRRVIEKMDIVYFMDPDDLELGSAYPYFRIYYREYRADGSYILRLCMVNAYLNTWRLSTPVHF